MRKILGRYYSAGTLTARLLLLLTLITVIFSLETSFQQPLQPFSPLLNHKNFPSLDRDSSVFTLRHVFQHGDPNHPTVYKRFDIIDPQSAMWIESEAGTRQQETRSLSIKHKPVKINRLKDRRPPVVDSIMNVARDFPQIWSSLENSWTVDTVNAPDVTDTDTILTLAQMSANAYLDNQDTNDWQNIHGGYNWSHSRGFGWDGDGLQGYLYADENNSTVVIALKGTSVAIWDGEGTSRNDKENDNLFFSCCCGQQGNAFYRKVCNCATSRYTCDMGCLKHSLTEENRYYVAGRHLYKNITSLYPNSSIWFTGHSLGGSIGSMIGLTYGTPVVTFEAIPDALPVNRLGIPVPPGVDPERPGQREHTGVFHFGNTADPIFMGTCNGAIASCSYAGYALESSCHTGQECIWDLVVQNSTRANILHHRIHYVIDHIIKKWTEVPKCYHTSGCHDCILWKEVFGNFTKTSTYLPSVTSTRTRTRTSTCKTPGWWGCRDEITTTSETSTLDSSSTITSTTIAPTTTCHTPGWFGCNDKTVEENMFPEATTFSSDSTIIKHQIHSITPSPANPT